MHCCIMVSLCAVGVAAAVAGAQRQCETLNTTAGENATLTAGATKLQPDDHIIWSYGPKRLVLYNSNDEPPERNTPERFQLDETGSLNIQPLAVNDSGLYEVQIINGKSSTRCFNLTVVEPVPPPAGPQRTWIMCLVVGETVFILVLVVSFACAVHKKKIPGQCCHNEVI